MFAELLQKLSSSNKDASANATSESPHMSKEVQKQFSNLFAQLKDVVSCDSKCQNDKKESQLEQDFLNAQKTMKSAPSDLQNSFKKLVEQKKGKDE